MDSFSLPKLETNSDTWSTRTFLLVTMCMWIYSICVSRAFECVHVLLCEDVRSSVLCVGMWVFICFNTGLPLWPLELKHEPRGQSLRQCTAITGANFPKDSSLTTSGWPSKHKHSWFKRWYKHIKRCMNYILHLPFRRLAGNLIQSDICFEFLSVIIRRQEVIMFLYFFFSLIWTPQLCTLMALKGNRKQLFGFHILFFLSVNFFDSSVF